jgi:hypothetical protein
LLYCQNKQTLKTFGLSISDIVNMLNDFSERSNKRDYLFMAIEYALHALGVSGHPSSLEPLHIPQLE